MENNMTIEEIELLNNRIQWIDVHEKMFELSPILVMERECCKERLKELEAQRNADN